MHYCPCYDSYHSVCGRRKWRTDSFRLVTKHLRVPCFYAKRNDVKYRSKAGSRHGWASSCSAAKKTQAAELSRVVPVPRNGPSVSMSRRLDTSFSDIQKGVERNAVFSKLLRESRPSQSRKMSAWTLDDVFLSLKPCPWSLRNWTGSWMLIFTQLEIRVKVDATQYAYQ